jgi:hypothetical protein
MVGQLDRRQVHVVVSSPFLLVDTPASAHPVFTRRPTLTITVTARTAAEAQGAANAVARCYVDRVSPPGAPGGQKRAAAALYNATQATGTSVSAWVLQTAGFGTLVGLMLGAIAALTMTWVPRRQQSGL